MFVNLCPHKIDIVKGDGTVLTVPPSGQVARVKSIAIHEGVVDGIVLTRTEFGPVEGLPDPVEGTVFIVSGLVAGRVTGRPDVRSPGDLVRNAEGQPIGCRGLTRSC